MKTEYLCYLAAFAVLLLAGRQTESGCACGH